MTARKNAQMKRQRERLMHEQNGRCYWCGVAVVLVPQHVKSIDIPDNAATIDHLDSRLSEERGKHQGEVRHVVACRACNLLRSALEQSAVGLQELWRRSGRFPRCLRIPIAERVASRTD